MSIFILCIFLIGDEVYNLCIYGDDIYKYLIAGMYLSQHDYTVPPSIGLNEPLTGLSRRFPPFILIACLPSSLPAFQVIDSGYQDTGYRFLSSGCENIMSFSQIT